MVARQRGNADSKVSLARIAMTDEIPLTCGQRGGRLEPRDDAVSSPECSIGKFDGPLVVEVPGDRDDHVGRAIRARPEVADRLLGQRPDPGFVAADLAAERTVAEDGLLEEDLAVLGR